MISHGTLSSTTSVAPLFFCQNPVAWGTTCPTHAVGRVAFFYQREPEFVLSDTFLFSCRGTNLAIVHMPAVVHARKRDYSRTCLSCHTLACQCKLMFCPRSIFCARVSNTFGVIIASTRLHLFLASSRERSSPHKHSRKLNKTPPARRPREFLNLEVIEITW